MWDWDWLASDNATTAIALVSLGVSLSLLALGWWRNREASVTAFLLRGDEGHADHLVIHNFGARWADDVDLKLEMRGGGEPRGVVQQKPNTDLEELPIPRLHAGEKYYIDGVFKLAAAEPAQATLTWRDGRRGTRYRTVHLSRHPR